MDTIYYHLNAKRVKVSGGADLLTFVSTPALAPEAPAGEVLDFARCRQRLETKNAWKDLVTTANISAVDAGRETLEDPARDAAEEEAVSGGSLPQNRGNHPPVWLDVAASLAVIATALAATLAFLGLV